MEQRSEEFGLENVFRGNYLGSPDVVARIVQDFLDKAYEDIKKAGAGIISEEDFNSDWVRWGKEFSDIFLGRNSDYIKTVGWNSPYGLGIGIKQSLGTFWEKYKGKYNNDPGQALFGYLAAFLIDCCNEALKDPDAAGMKLNDKKQQIIKLLLGLEPEEIESCAFFCQPYNHITYDKRGF